MKFSDLSKGQKRCVLALIKASPKLKKSNQTTRKDIVAAWEIARAKGEPIGFPNWFLVEVNKTSEGYYLLPQPSGVDIEEYLHPPAKPKVKPAKKAVIEEKPIILTKLRKEYDANQLPEEDMEYYAELDKYGIPF